MKGTKVLAAAVGFDRFTAADIVSLSGASRQLVSEVLARLEKEGSLEVGRELWRRGRPTKLYSWIPQGLEQARAELLERAAPWVEIEDKAVGGWIDDPVEDALRRLDGLLSAAERSTDGRRSLMLSAQMDVVLEGLEEDKHSASTDQRLQIEAARIRIRQLRRADGLERIRGELTNRFSEKLLDAAAYLTPSTHSVAIGRWRESMAAPSIAIVIDVAGNLRETEIVRSTVENTGVSCLVLPFAQAEPSRARPALDLLATFMLSPASSFCVFLLADVAGWKRQMAEITALVDDRGRLLEIAGRVQDAYSEVLLRSDERNVAIHSSSVLYNSSLTDPLGHGFGRLGMLHGLLTRPVGPSDLDRILLLKWIMRDPVLLNTGRGAPGEIWRNSFECRSVNDGSLPNYLQSVVLARQAQLGSPANWQPNDEVVANHGFIPHLGTHALTEQTTSEEDGLVLPLGKITDNGGTDVVIHVSGTDGVEIQALAKGQRIAFELAEHGGRISAIDLRTEDDQLTSSHGAGGKEKAAGSRKTGTVKFFNGAKGFGFIAPDGTSKDAFVHISAVERAGISALGQEGRVRIAGEIAPKGRNDATEIFTAKKSPVY